MRFIKDLKGFSGCKVKLYSVNGDYLVRKISKSVDYNERLQKQMLKQKYFLEYLATDKILAQKIFNTSSINKLYFFDMEYIQGINLIEYI